MDVATAVFALQILLAPNILNGSKMAKHRNKEDKLTKRFYGVLVLLEIIGKVQGDQLAGETVIDPNLGGVRSAEMRRTVIYHLCVMCDYDKGGDTVTAMAAEDLPEGPRYWLAVNGPSGKIRGFLLEVLGMLERGISIDRSDLERQLFEKFVAFHRRRISQYWLLLISHIKREIKRIVCAPDAEGIQ
jgi:hypothetical protein